MPRRNRPRLFLIDAIRVLTPCAPLLREPDDVEGLVEVVAGRDLPALDLGGVRDDPVPLQGHDEMDLLVEQPLLEGPDDLLALLDILRAALPLVEVIEDRIIVAAIVRGLLVDRDEAIEVQVRLHD